MSEKIGEEYSVLSKHQQEIFNKIKDNWEKRIGKGKVEERRLKRLIIMADTQFDGKKRVTVKGTTYLVPIEDIVLYGLAASEIDKYPTEVKK